MAINLTDELNAATKKGKIASAKQVYLEGDQENLQQIGDKTHQLEQSIKDISATGGASTANAVSYSNETSGMIAVNTQAAIDELAAKNKTQDSTIASKADAADVTSNMQEEQTRVNAELDKKFNKENIAQEFGDAEDKVVSQFALPFREIESPEFLKLIVDAENHVLFGIQLDGSIEWSKGIPAPIRAKLQEIINQSQQDKTDILEALNTAKEELSASIVNLQDTKVDKEEGKSLIDDEVKDCFKVIENEEFIHAITDSEDRLLFGIYRETGKPYFPLNDMYHVEQNEEFFAVWLDAEDHMLFGIRRDGEIIGSIPTLINLNKKVENLEKNINFGYLKALSSVINVEEITNFDTSSLNDVNGALEKSENSEYIYVCYKNKFDTLTLVKEFNVDLYGASDKDIGDEYTFLLGEIDQRNWFLPRTTFTAKVTDVTDGMLSFLFDNIIAKEGEVIMLCAHCTKNAKDIESSKIINLYNNNTRKNIPVFTRDLNVALSDISSDGIKYPDIRIVVTGVSYNGIFSNNVNFSEVQASVSSNTDLVNKKQNIKLVDSENGKKYKLKVKNGQLTLKSLDYDKILCLGNSFTIGWYGRSLASTTDKTPYYEHIKNVSGASVVDHAGWVTLERSLLDTDFQNIPNKSNSYDAILVQLGENIVSTDTSTIYQTFVKAFQAIKSNWKDADVFFVFGRVIGNKPYPICKAIMQAALDEEVEYTDCSSVSLQEHSLRGDFAYDDKNNLVEIWDAAYSSHPSDIGCYRIAEKVLELMGFSSTIPSRMFNIDKIQSEGGTISTASNRWISDGLVTVQCIPDEDYSIKNVIVTKESGESIKTTEKENSLGFKCYVFLMPDANVTISATFTNV